MPARILYASDDPLDQRAVADALRDEGHELVLSTNGPDVMRSCELMPPDLLIIDVALPILNGYEIVRGIRESEGAGTHLPVMLIGEDQNVGAKVQALRGGADDYLSKPLDAEEVAARATGLLARFTPVERRRTRGTVHAYYGAKGGVGTTTIAVNTAIALRRKHKSTVALVDGNLHFGDHRLFLDVRLNTHSIVDVCSGHEIDDEVVRKVMVHHPSGIDLMLAPTRAHEAEHVSMESHHLLQIVEVLRGMYDYVVVDLDKRLDDHDLDIISTANRIFVVMTADLPSLKNVRLLTDTMGQLSVPEDRMELVLNRASASTGISHQSAEWVLKRRIKHQIVNDYRTAATSLNNGTPFIIGKSESAIAKAVLQFADAIREKDSEPVLKNMARSSKRPDWLNRGTPFLAQDGNVLVAHTADPVIDEPARRYVESYPGDQAGPELVAAPEPTSASAPDATFQADTAAPELVAATEQITASEPESTFQTAPAVIELPATAEPMTTEALFDAAMIAAGWPTAAEALARHRVDDLNDEPVAVEEVEVVELVASDTDHTRLDEVEREPDPVVATTHKMRPEVMLTDVFADYRVVVASLSNGSSPTNGSVTALSDTNGTDTNGSLPGVPSSDSLTTSPAVEFAEVIRELAMTSLDTSPSPAATPPAIVEPGADDRDADTRSLDALIEREIEITVGEAKERSVRWAPAQIRSQPTADSQSPGPARSWPLPSTVAELRSRQGRSNGHRTPTATRAARIFRTWVDGR